MKGPETRSACPSRRLWIDPPMTEEILINVSPREARVGVVENGMLQEVHVERSGRRGYVGNIYCGRVKRVMPGMQAAFVDIGLERSAFLHAADMAHQIGR